MKRVGFIGLGNIGRGICSNLIKQGNEMTVYDVYRPAMEKSIVRLHEIIKN